MLTKVILKSGKDQSAKRFHPWIFSGAIKKIKGDVEEGDLVEVYDNHDEFLALGHYQIGSIAVRIISFKNVPVDQEFWNARIAEAVERRRRLGFLSDDATNVFRMIYAEGDYLPGLIADYYNGTVVLQMHSIGMYLAKDSIIEGLKNSLGGGLKAVYDKSSGTLPHKAKIEAVDGYLYGTPESFNVCENGANYEVDWIEGQKTGFFIDQRENRSLLAEYSKGKKVLNLFGYSGGFSIAALKKGAFEVHTVDCSAKAIDLAEKNASLNDFNGVHKGVVSDAFDYLDQHGSGFDIIILDPPAFAKHHDVLHNALQGYKRLNQKAFENIKSGGIVFTFSCSQVVSKENFRKSVFAAAANSGRKVNILHQLSQPGDHPISIYHPEGEYLKGIVLMVD